MVRADMHNAHANFKNESEISCWSHSYVSGKDEFTSSILLILFNCTSHVSFEIGRRRFKPGEGPIRGLLNDCETSIFAKIRLQL